MRKDHHKKKIIAIDTGSYPVGGAGTNRNSALLKGLCEHGCTVELLLLTPSNTQSTDSNKLEGWSNGFFYKYMTRSTIWPKSRIIKLVTLIRAFFNLLFELNHNKTNIQSIVIFFYNPPIVFYFLTLFLKLKRLPFYFEMTETPEVFWKKNSMKWKLYHKNLSAAKGAFVINQYLKTYFSQYIAPNKIQVINMVVDSSRFDLKESSPFKFNYMAYCGTMYGNKDGLKDLIAAYSLIKNKLKEKLVLIGNIDDPRAKHLINMVSELNLKDDVIFTGIISSTEIPRYLSNATSLLLARSNNKQSKGGFPTKLGEYLLTERPVVITKTGEIANFLRHNESAYLAEPDNPVNFSENILKAIQPNINNKLIGQSGADVARKNFNYYTEAGKMFQKLSTLE